MPQESFQSADQLQTHESQVSLETEGDQELLSIFQQTGKPLHWLEIERHLGNDEGDGRVYLLRTKPILEALIDANLIIQIEEKPGFFALAELHKASGQAKPIQKQIAKEEVAALQKSDSPINRKNIEHEPLPPTDENIKSGVAAVLQNAAPALGFQKTTQKAKKPRLACHRSTARQKTVGGDGRRELHRYSGSGYLFFTRIR